MTDNEKVKMVTLKDFLTPAEIRRAYYLWEIHRDTGHFARNCDKLIIAPNIARINAQLGQENSSRYLAYMVEYVFSQVKQQ